MRTERLWLHNRRLEIKHIFKIHHVRHIQRFHHDTAPFVIRHDHHHLFRPRNHTCYVTGTGRILTGDFPVHFLVGILHDRTDSIHESHVSLPVHVTQSHHPFRIGIDHRNMCQPVSRVLYSRFFIRHLENKRIFFRYTRYFHIQILLERECIRTRGITGTVSNIHVPQISVILRVKIPVTNCNLRRNL